MQEDDEEELSDEELSEDDEEEEEYEYDELVSTLHFDLDLQLVVLIQQPALANQEIDEGDQAILDNYMPQGQLENGETLADLIMRRINEQEEGTTRPAQGMYYLHGCYPV